MARGKAKKAKSRAGAKGKKRPAKRAKATRRPAGKTAARPAADAALRRRVTELEAENRRLRDELAALRARRTEPSLPFGAVEEPTSDVD